MKTTTAISTLLSLPLLAAAFPAANPGTITAEDIIKVAPQTASCSGRGSQCATAAQAAPAIAASFKKWGIISFGSQAAIVSTMLYESDNFAYDSPVSPVPGKGTRNMQSATYNEQYASALGKPGASVDELNANVEDSFGSGAWFVAANCPMSVRDQMHAQEAEGYTNYVTQCLGTSELSERTQIWNSLLALKQW